MGLITVMVEEIVFCFIFQTSDAQHVADLFLKDKTEKRPPCWFDTTLDMWTRANGKGTSAIHISLSFITLYKTTSILFVCSFLFNQLTACTMKAILK